MHKTTLSCFKECVNVPRDEEGVSMYPATDGGDHLSDEENKCIDSCYGRTWAFQMRVRRASVRGRPAALGPLCCAARGLQVQRR